MAKTKRFDVEDPAGVEWTQAATEAWEEAQRRSEKDGRAAVDHFAGFVDRGKRGKETKVEALAPALPDFGAEAAPHVKGPVLGRFLYHPESGLVHDVNRATPDCRIGDTPRVFIHFASEIEGAVEEKAKPHAACMG